MAPSTQPEAQASAPAPEAGAPPAAGLSLALDDTAIRIGATRIDQLGAGRYRFSGDVDIRHGEMRLQADEIEYDENTRQCLARGNVVLEEGGSRLSGEQIDINLGTGLATLFGAHGEMPPDFIFEAERLEKIGEDRYRLIDATVTSCTQPVPYWSFRIGSGTLRLDRYAHLRNLALKIGHVPVFYTPYLMWPIKEDRASGLLMPQFGYSQRRGVVVNSAWYWAPARNFDSTLYFDYLEKDGIGAGIETRWLPSRDGHLRLTGYWIDERIDDPFEPGNEREGERYRFHFDADQKLGAGWRVLADLNQVSDFDYYLDFERDLRAAANRSNTSALELTRSWSYYTFNLRGERRQQLLFGDDVLEQHRRPEIELRGRSRRLGRSPFHLSFEGSATALERNASYGRLDAFPKIRAPFRPAPWLEITPSVSYRETYYTRQRDPADPDSLVERSLSRGLPRGDLEVIGPRFSRIFETPNWGFSPRLKNVIEPRLTYTFVPDVADIVSGPTSRIPIFDEIDSQVDDLHRLDYSLTWRWFALRSAGPGTGALALPRRVPLPGLAGEPQSPREVAVPFVDAAATGGDPGALHAEAGAGSRAEESAAGAPGASAAQAPAGDTEGTAAAAAAEAPPLNPVEFLTFTLSQTYGLNGPQSVRRDDMQNIIDTSDFSPVNATLRLNPTARHSLNIGATYNILRRTVERTTLSADLRSADHLLTLTWFLGNNPDPPDQSQVRLFAGTAFFRRKVTLALETKVDLALSEVRDQRYRIGYNTQCCGFLVEYLDRDFTLTEEREYRFLVNLKGVGTLFDLQQGLH